MSDTAPHVDANTIHIAAMALHLALVQEADRLERSVTSLGAGWNPDARDGWVDTDTTTLAEALLRAGWQHPPPALS